jgi:hypothetical protein
VLARTSGLAFSRRRHRYDRTAHNAVLPDDVMSTSVRSAHDAPSTWPFVAYSKRNAAYAPRTFLCLFYREDEFIPFGF